MDHPKLSNNTAKAIRFVPSVLRRVVMAYEVLVSSLLTDSSLFSPFSVRWEYCLFRMLNHSFRFEPPFTLSLSVASLSSFDCVYAVRKSACEVFGLGRIDSFGKGRARLLHARGCLSAPASINNALICRLWMSSTRTDKYTYNREVLHPKIGLLPCHESKHTDRNPVS